MNFPQHCHSATRICPRNSGRTDFRHRESLSPHPAVQLNVAFLPTEPCLSMWFFHVFLILLFAFLCIGNWLHWQTYRFWTVYWLCTYRGNQWFDRIDGQRMTARDVESQPQTADVERVALRRGPRRGTRPIFPSSINLAGKPWNFRLLGK